MKKKYKLVIFDFDGTLVDTIEDVIICFNQSLEMCGFPKLDSEYIKTLIGGDLETIVSRLLPLDCISRDNIDMVKKNYRYLYLNSLKEHSKPYDGIMELISYLKENKILIAINSNKGQSLLVDMVDKIFGPNIFECVLGYDENFPSKPDPYGVFRILDMCNVKLEDAIYVGDGNSDLLTAKNAGIDFVYVSWGQGSVEEYTFFADTVDKLKYIII